MHAECADAYSQCYKSLEIQGSTVEITAVHAMDRSQIPSQARTMGISVTPYLEEEGGYIDVKYPAGLGFRLVHKNDIISTLRNMKKNTREGNQLAWLNNLNNGVIGA